KFDVVMPPPNCGPLCQTMPVQNVEHIGSEADAHTLADEEALRDAYIFIQRAALARVRLHRRSIAEAVGALRLIARPVAYNGRKPPLHGRYSWPDRNPSLRPPIRQQPVPVRLGNLVP